MGGNTNRVPGGALSCIASFWIDSRQVVSYLVSARMPRLRSGFSEETCLGMIGSECEQEKLRLGDIDLGK